MCAYHYRVKKYVFDYVHTTSTETGNDPMPLAPSLTRRRSMSFGSESVPSFGSSQKNVSSDLDMECSPATKAKNQVYFEESKSRKSFVDL